MAPSDLTRTASAVVDDAALTRTSAGQSTDGGGGPDAGGGWPTLPGYEVLALLGRGGMGLVFKAMQVSLHRLVAIKTVRGAEVADPVALIRFWGEAEAVADLHHPHVVQVYELGQYDRTPFLAMEYLPGGSLADRLAQSGPLPADAAVALVEKIARGVNAAHEHGVVHRDVKPSNVLFDECGEPRVTDFGLAKRGGGGDLTQTQAIMGTPAYMAPEQAGGRAKFVGPPADVWALGVMLYECLTGRRPFTGESTADILDHVQHDEPKSVRSFVRSLPRDLETICRKALAKEPNRRYQTAGEFADDLHRWLAGEPIKARPLTAAQRAARWARKRPAAAALVAVSVLAGGVIGVGGWVSAADLRSALADAQDARTAAERSAADADRQRQAVVDGEQARFLALDDMLLNLDTRLKNAGEGDAEAVRKDLTAELVKQMQQIRADRPDDAASVRVAARLYTRHGEAALAARDFAGGEQAYARAADAFRRLADLITPDDADVRKEWAAAVYHRGRALGSAGRWADAAAAFAAAAGLFDQLVDRPGQPRAPISAARCRYQAANALAMADRTADAVALFTTTLTAQTALAAARPADADVLEDLGLTATALGLATPTDPAGVAHLRTALDAYRQAQKADPTGRRLPAAVERAYIDLGEALERHKRDADLVALAGEYAAARPNANGLYNAACFTANAARCAAARGAADDADRHGKAAVAYLAQSVAAGWKDRAHLVVDADLDPLRDRGDFQAVVAGLNKKAGDRPAHPVDVLKKIREVYDGVAADRAKATAATATFADKRRAELPRPGSGFDRFAALALKLADDHPDTPTAASALVWVVEAVADAKLTGEAARPADEAVAKLSKYVARPEFQNVCRTLATRGSDRTDRLLAAAAAQQPSEKGRGLAAFYLAASYTRQAEAAPVGSKEQADLFAKAEAGFQQVSKEFGAVTVNDVNLGEEAERRLTAARHLSVGRPAREVSGADLDGKGMKLSEFRGKVVLLDFWANWCGFCREMYPAERAMVTKYADRPFALVGVNCDGEKAVARRAVEREKLNWRSWFDGAGGPISTAWQVDGYPHMVLLDANGVIRKKWMGKADAAEIEKAVDAVLAETAKK